MIRVYRAILTCPMTHVRDWRRTDETIRYRLPDPLAPHRRPGPVPPPSYISVSLDTVEVRPPFIRRPKGLKGEPRERVRVDVPAIIIAVIVVEGHAPDERDVGAGLVTWWPEATVLGVHEAIPEAA